MPQLKYAFICSVPFTVKLHYLDHVFTALYSEDGVQVQGVAFKKTFSYAGFEQQPKSFTNPKVLLNSRFRHENEKHQSDQLSAFGSVSLI